MRDSSRSGSHSSSFGGSGGSILQTPLPEKTPNVIVPMPKMTVKPNVGHQQQVAARLAAPKHSGAGAHARGSSGQFLAPGAPVSGTEAARRANLVADAAARAKRDNAAAAGAAAGAGAGPEPGPDSEGAGVRGKGGQYLRGLYSSAQEESVATAAQTYRRSKRRDEMQRRMAAQKRALEDLMLDHGGVIVDAKPVI